MFQQGPLRRRIFKSGRSGRSGCGTGFLLLHSSGGTVSPLRSQQISSERQLSATCYESAGDKDEEDSLCLAGVCCLLSGDRQGEFILPQCQLMRSEDLQPEACWGRESGKDVRAPRCFDRGVAPGRPSGVSWRVRGRQLKGWRSAMGFCRACECSAGQVSNQQRHWAGSLRKGR